MLMGNNATVAIRPFLFVNLQPAPVSLMTNINADIKFTNSQTNVVVVKTCSDLKVDDNMETTITFEVPSNISQLEIEFTAIVKKTLVNQKQELKAVYQIPIETHKNDNVYFDFYLNSTPKDGYQLHVLGKNGEPIANLPVTLSFYSKFLQNAHHEKVITTSTGIVKLGALANVSSYTSRCKIRLC